MIIEVSFENESALKRSIDFSTDATNEIEFQIAPELFWSREKLINIATESGV